MAKRRNGGGIRGQMFWYQTDWSWCTDQCIIIIQMAGIKSFSHC